MPNVLVADDHPVSREGLVRIIEREGKFSVVAQAGDGGEALKLIQQLRPDLAVLDISMPTMTGIEVVREAMKQELPTEFVIMTLYDDSRYFDAAMDAGVKGYLLKDSAVPELSLCLGAVADGKFYITPSMSKLMLDRRARIQALARSVPALDKLTPAEREVLRLLADNKTNKEIADELFTAVRTVENHRSHITAKLGLKGYNKLLIFAIEHRALL
jgi:DNA-binding NarL/FixJ family response regulator